MFRPATHCALEETGMLQRTTKDASQVFAQPRKGVKLEDCQFYHMMDIPGYGTVNGFEGGNWDLRPNMRDFLGGISFAGKRVLEVGPASGLLTFEMEKRGAEMVSAEIPEDHVYDVVPYFGMETDWQSANELGWRPLTNSFWFAHEKNNSGAKVVYSAGSDLHKLDIGQFDISYLSNMLLHSRDPLKILQNCAAITTETMVIVDIVDHALESSGLPLMKFQPNPAAKSGEEDWNQWWRLSSHFVTKFLGVMGFKRFDVTKFSPMWNGIPVESFRVVASRT